MIGTTLSHYKIEAELGRGGMGIVYRAEDTKLGRTVAIKVLPPSALASDDDRARFYREAKAAAALNHQNIAGIYQIDEAVPEGGSGEEPRPFIAMEYIDGETLDARIKKGPLKLTEAVKLATQIAGGLGEAHDKGIVHRDVKASNVMLTSKGDAKVLDFGLALTAASTKLTRMGSTLGTVAYMSPEQARGEEVDHRTDLWALGVVLYEMIAGRNPFGGDYEQAVVYSILNADPEPLTAVRTGVPMELERITTKALAKDPGLRYQTAAGLIADLRALDLGGSGAMHSRSAMLAVSAPSVAAGQNAARQWNAKSYGLLVLVVVMGIALGWIIGAVTAHPSDEPRVERLMLDVEGMRMINTVGLSPGGRFLAMTGYDWEGREGLFFYDTQTGERTHTERSEGAFYPWFSPNGQQLVYSHAQNVFLVDVPAGSPTVVADSARAAYWLDESRILYTRNLGHSRSRNVVLDLDTGVETPISGTDNQNSQYHFPGPRIPDSDWAISNIQGSAAFGIEPRLVLTDLEELRASVLDIPGINPQPLTSKVVIYQLGDDAGELVARRFDPGSGKFVSPPMPFKKESSFASFQADPTTGSFVFLPDHTIGAIAATVFDVDAETLTTFDIAGSDGQLNETYLSQDGSTVIATVISGETGESNVITIDLASKSTVTRVETGSEYGLDILPGGSLLSLAYSRENFPDIDEYSVITRSFGSQAVDTLTQFGAKIYYGGRRANRAIVSTQNSKSDARSIGWLDLQTGAISLLTNGKLPDLSPDGRHVAFNRDDYLMAVLDISSGAVHEITGVRGRSPNWSSDGASIYFLNYENAPGTSAEAEVSRIPVSVRPTFSVEGPPEFVLHAWYPRALDVRRDAVLVMGLGEVSQQRPPRVSARIGLWRHVGHELEESLPR